MTARKTLQLLRTYESRNITFIEPDGSWPIVWERARGVYVWDANGKQYLDLTAAFGVAATGHANPDRKSTRLNSSHLGISYAVFCLKKKKINSPSVAISCILWGSHLSMDILTDL